MGFPPRPQRKIPGARLIAGGRGPDLAATFLGLLAVAAVCGAGEKVI